MADVTAAVADVRDVIESATHHGVTSDDVLAAVGPRLSAHGFEVERSKKKADKIWRPVLFGEAGKSRVAYEVDAFHAAHGVVVEIEAGRGAANNADYRDLIRASLMVDARFLVLAMMQEYTSGKDGKAVTVRSYEKTRDRLDAIYASERLRLPLEGILLVGY